MGACRQANGASGEADSCEHLSQLLQMLERQRERERKNKKQSSGNSLRLRSSRAGLPFQIGGIGRRDRLRGGEWEGHSWRK